MTEEIKHLGDLRQDPANARRHNPRNVGLIADALREVGAARSGVIDEEGRILAGNATAEALAEVGIERVKVVEADGDEWVVVRRSGLTEEQKKRLALFDNRTAELADWDPEILAGLLSEDETLLDGLFENFELEELLGDLMIPEPPEDPGPQIDRAAELQEKWQVQRGQVWEILSGTVPGKCHRVMCGDSTSEEDMGRLMGGERADMMFTDPPYGVDYRGGHFHSGDVNIVRERAPLKGDREDIYAQFMPLVPVYVDGPCYVWFASSVGKPVYDALLASGCEIHAMIIWHKTNATYAAMNAQYKQRHEPLMYFKPKGSTLRWSGPTNECTMWEMDRLPSNKNHPTEKPATLAVRAIGNHQADSVLDLFLGSGTTIVACEQTGRIGYGMEIEPKYVAVTLERLADMGLEPRLAEEHGEPLDG